MQTKEILFLKKVAAKLTLCDKYHRLARVTKSKPKKKKYLSKANKYMRHTNALCYNPKHGHTMEAMAFQSHLAHACRFPLVCDQFRAASS